MVKLQSNKAADIPVRELKDGQIGVTTQWGGYSEHVGKVVQRFGDRVISIGEAWEYSYLIVNRGFDCRVRILEEGETLVITNNQ